jgi:hypothetical protein
MARHDVQLHRRPGAGSGPMTACEEELGVASGAGDELLDVIVIGGSQAGLAMAWHLARQHLRTLPNGHDLRDADERVAVRRATSRRPGRRQEREV